MADPYGLIPDVDDQGNPGQVAKFRQWNPDPVGNSNSILNTVHPDLQAVVRRAQSQNPNLPFAVALGKSTAAQQNQAKAWGWSQQGAGPNAQHMQGNVVDLWPVNGQGQVNFDPNQQRQINTAMQSAAGDLGVSLRWGGLKSEGGANNSFRDAPNFQILNPRPWSQAQANPLSQSASAAKPAPTAATPFSPGAMPTSGVPSAGQYQPAINAAASKYNIDPNFFSRLLFRENGFKPQGTSPAGAQGIAQFMPGTAARYGVNANDPNSSIDGAAHYLGDLSQRYGGNLGLAAAGYNWGENNVDAWLQGKGKPPPGETTAYVQNITGHSINDWRADPNLKMAAFSTPLTPSTSTTPPGTTLTSTPGVASGPVAGALPGFSDKATSDTFTKGIQQITGQDPAAAQQQQEQLSSPPPMGPAPQLVRPNPQMAHQIAQQIGGVVPGQGPGQVYGQTLTSIQNPMAWGGAPPGAPPPPPGTQTPGTSIGSLSMQQMQQYLSPYALGESPYGQMNYGGG